MAQNISFNIEKKGYNIEQVETVIDDLIAKNNYLTGRVSELEQKLETARRLIRRFTESENTLRQDIADSKRAAAEMITDTKERSETLLDKTRESCGELISDLDVKISDRMNVVDAIRAEVASFKDQLFAMYSSHIDLIESIAATAENFVYEPDYTKISDAIDEFEEKGEPECESHEFSEYPQESIFEGFDEEEDELFTMGEAEPSSEAEMSDTEEFVTTEVPESSEEDTDGIEFKMADEEAEPEEQAEEEQESFKKDAGEDNSEKKDISDDEYYRFLEDFINDDDGTLSDPDDKN